MVDKKSIAVELAKGLKPVEISKSLGVSPSYLSQLMADSSFISLVDQAKEILNIAKTENEVSMLREQLKEKLDDSWDEIEELAVIALKDKLALGVAMKTGELLSIASIANKATRKSQESLRGMAVNEGDTVIQLNIGNVLFNRGERITTVLNERNQVISVGDTPLVNASQQEISRRLDELRNRRMPTLPTLGALPSGLCTEDL